MAKHGRHPGCACWLAGSDAPWRCPSLLLSPIALEPTMTFPRTCLPLLLATAIAALPACQRDAARTGDVAGTGPAPAAARAVVAAVAPLSAKDELEKVMDGFLNVRSYHATMDSANAKGAITMEMDFVAPDRYSITMPMGTQYVIGDTMYMTVQGRTMKVPLPKGQIANYRDPARFEADKATMTVEALGSDTVDGQAARKYLVRNTRPTPIESTLWVGGDGFPLRIEVASDTGGINTRTTIRYSRFNDPGIRVDPPQ
jgi:hypothetical protein